MPFAGPVQFSGENDFSSREGWKIVGSSFGSSLWQSCSVYWLPRHPESVFITECALSCRGEDKKGFAMLLRIATLNGLGWSRVVEFLSNLVPPWLWLGPVFGSQDAIESKSGHSKVEGFHQDN